MVTTNSFLSVFPLAFLLLTMQKRALENFKYHFAAIVTILNISIISDIIKYFTNNITVLTMLNTSNLRFIHFRYCFGSRCTNCVQMPLILQILTSSVWFVWKDSHKIRVIVIVTQFFLPYATLFWYFSLLASTFYLVFFYCG